MSLRAGLACVVFLLWLGGCHQPQAPRADWIIRSQLVFLSADFTTERAPLAPNQFRLFFPYIAGDLYGAPTTGDFLNPVLGPDYRFEIDLNRSHAALLASLEPTDFSVPYLKITPADTRVARLAPMVLQADGIEPVGRTDWLDRDSRRTLMLLYLDRPATIAGKSASVEFAIRAATPGYVWVGSQPGPVGTVYSVVPTPAHLWLAVTPQ